MQGSKSKSSWQAVPAIFAHQGARTALALAISASLSLPSLAQGPVTDMDNWTRFPPRPRTPAPFITVTASPPTTQAPTPRDSWVQFPIRSATPAVMNVPPLQTQAPTQLLTPVAGKSVAESEEKNATTTTPLELAANEPKIKNTDFAIH